MAIGAAAVDQSRDALAHQHIEPLLGEDAQAPLGLTPCVLDLGRIEPQQPPRHPVDEDRIAVDSLDLRCRQCWRDKKTSRRHDDGEPTASVDREPGPSAATGRMHHA